MTSIVAVGDGKTANNSQKKGYKQTIFTKKILYSHAVSKITTNNDL